uniref:hypothetical protein n=1 Tax=Fluviicola sp. TaxID=1917219 RepID=UPI00404A1285
MKILGIITGIMVLLSACSSPKNEVNEVPSDWKKYSTNKVSISFPKNWKLNEQPQEGVQFNILAPIDGKNDDFRENINYITQNLTG